MDTTANATSHTDPSDVLVLDAETRADLSLFTSESGADSLFDFCSQCRTEGGKRVLRRRMGAPWSSRKRILDTQQAITFILSTREAFAQLPSDYLTTNVQRYISSTLPLVRYRNRMAFVVSAFAVWFNDDHSYVKVSRGIELTDRLLEACHQFVGVHTGEQCGELGPLIEEMRQLLSRPGLEESLERGGSFWRRLRADQTFRLDERASIHRLLQLVYEMDALYALASVTQDHGFVLPTVGERPVQMQAEGLTHPFVADAVANPVALDQDHRILFLTGPNMAGKTTYLRAVATAIYFAHLGMGVPAQSFHFVPVSRLVTSISIRDSLDGVSYFRAEALRVRAIAQSVAERHGTIAILDEPFKGTNIKDAFDASIATLERLAVTEDCLVMVASHLIELKDRLNDTPHIDYRYFEAEEHDDRLFFDYVLHSGVSSQRLGMRVLREEGVFELLDEAAPGVTNNKQ